MKEKMVVSEYTASDAVEGTLEILRKYGWKQGDYGSPEDGYCLIGGMSRWEAESGWWTNSSFAAVLEATGCGIATWNDEPGRTQADVEELLMTVAKDLRNKGE